MYFLASLQGCQIGRFADKFWKFGRVSDWLAMQLLGWPFSYFWPFSWSCGPTMFVLAVFEMNFIF